MLGAISALRALRAFSNDFVSRCASVGFRKISLLEGEDVLLELLGEIVPRPSLLDPRAGETLHVVLIENRLHRLDALEQRAHLLDERRFEHACVHRGVIGVVLENVPSAENDIVEPGEGDEVLYQGHAVFGALAEADRPHLGERAVRLRIAAPDRLDSRVEGRRDGTHPRRENAELALRLRQLLRDLHERSFREFANRSRRARTRQIVCSPCRIKLCYSFYKRYNILL
jgi:hypothetical protein